jgi:flagellar biosynthetic protein FliR
VSAITADTVLAVFAIFCRIGSCLMLMPGTSSSLLPPQVRLFTAAALTFGLSPLLLPTVRGAIGDGEPFTVLSLVGSELIIGALIGLASRIYFLALQTLGAVMANAIGITAIPGVPIEDNEAMPSLASLISLSAVTLVFASGQHWELLAGLVRSYGVWPPTGGVASEIRLTTLLERLSASFMLALRVASPFLVYAVIVNLAVGLANKLTPTIPIYFISLPFVMAGGLILLYQISGDLLIQFMTGFVAWLEVQ